MTTTIRAPRPDELELLRDIERRAGAVFAGVGLADVAAHEPESREALAEYMVAERIWLVADAADLPIGYAIVDSVDGNAHLEQLSIVPEHGRQGLGAALVEHICTWAEMQGYAAVTLTTFEDVPWNAPFYAKVGFEAMTDAEIGPQLRALCEQEAAHGLDPAARVCMRRPI